MIELKCASCGAKLTLSLQCEYCGSIYFREADVPSIEESYIRAHGLCDLEADYIRTYGVAAFEDFRDSTIKAAELAGKGPIAAANSVYLALSELRKIEREIDQEDKERNIARERRSARPSSTFIDDGDVGSLRLVTHYPRPIEWWE